jgi:hypothetical protein
MWFFGGGFGHSYAGKTLICKAFAFFSGFKKALQNEKKLLLA